MVYINDISNCVNSSMKLFADDCVVFRRIDDSDDRAILQEDLDTLNRWAEKWLVKFNVSKCKVMNVTLK